jgi:uncharacterized protein YndB with AHSA1/START domain
VRLASHQVRIAAPIEVVWAHLTTAEGLVRWVGPAATADPAPGGVLRWTHPDGSTVVGHFVEVVPPRRVVFTYGWEDGQLGVPPGSTTVESDLVEEDGATTVRLVHHGLPPQPSRTTSGDGPTSSASLATPSRPGPVAPRLAASGGGRRLPARGR